MKELKECRVLGVGGRYCPVETIHELSVRGGVLGGRYAINSVSTEKYKRRNVRFAFIQKNNTQYFFKQLNVSMITRNQ